MSNIVRLTGGAIQRVTPVYDTPTVVVQRPRNIRVQPIISIPRPNKTQTIRIDATNLFAGTLGGINYVTDTPGRLQFIESDAITGRPFVRMRGNGYSFGTYYSNSIFAQFHGITNSNGRIMLESGANFRTTLTWRQTSGPHTEWKTETADGLGYPIWFKNSTVQYVDILEAAIQFDMLDTMDDVVGRRGTFIEDFPRDWKRVDIPVYTSGEFGGNPIDGQAIMDGTVTEKGSPIHGILVRALEVGGVDEYHTYTDKNGYYRFQFPASYATRVFDIHVVDRLGYNDMIRTRVIPKPEKLQIPDYPEYTRYPYSIYDSSRDGFELFRVLDDNSNHYYALGLRITDEKKLRIYGGAGYSYPVLGLDFVITGETLLSFTFAMDTYYNEFSIRLKKHGDSGWTIIFPKVSPKIPLTTFEHVIFEPGQYTVQMVYTFVGTQRGTLEIHNVGIHSISDGGKLLLGDDNNLFDIASANYGYIDDDGSVSATRPNSNNPYLISDYIQIEPNARYRYFITAYIPTRDQGEDNMFTQYCFYRADKTPIGKPKILPSRHTEVPGIIKRAYMLTAPADAAFIRIGSMYMLRDKITPRVVLQKR